MVEPAAVSAADTCQGVVERGNQEGSAMGVGYPGFRCTRTHSQNGGAGGEAACTPGSGRGLWFAELQTHGLNCRV